MKPNKTSENLERRFYKVFWLFAVSLALAGCAIWARSEGWGEYWRIISILFSLVAAALAVALFAMGMARLTHSNKN